MEAEILNLLDECVIVCWFGFAAVGVSDDFMFLDDKMY